jgi:hypothetical protein
MSSKFSVVRACGKWRLSVCSNVVLMISSRLFDSDNMCARFVVLLYDLPSGNHSVESESYNFTLEV